MTVPSKADRRKLIRERLANPALEPFQTQGDKHAAKGQKARRKGEAFQERIARDLKKIGQPFGFEESDIRSRSVTGHGEDIVFSPPAWNRFGRLWIECKHYTRSVDAENIFKQHAQKCGHKQKYGHNGIPILVHRCDYQPIMVTMRQDDLIALSEKPPDSSLRKEELVTVPWESVLQLLSRKVAAGGPVEPVVEVEDSEEIQF
jgi:hypothetical protein